MLNYLKQIFTYIFKKIEMHRFNEYTIEEYYRKKGFLIGRNNRIYIRNLDLSTESYLIKIGNHCTITAGVVFLTHDGGAWVFREQIPNLNVFGKIEIKDNCFIGINSIILHNVTIGPNSVVGAGAIVTKDVPPNTVVAGNPAKKICSIEEYKEKCIKKFTELNLNGPREIWQTQLIKHFWGNNNKKKGM
jgi:acetyltransferase-like isoleucine patch superfamily enzyme